MSQVNPRATTIPREIWVLVIAAFLVALGYGMVAPILPQFARSFDVSYTAAAWVISAFALFRLLFAPLSGRLTDRLGSRTVYLTGLVIVAVTVLACGLAASYWQLLIFRAVGGIGSTMFTVSAAALIVRISPPAIRGRASSTYATGFLLGNIIGPLLGGLLGVFGMHLPFFLYGGMLLIATVVVFFALSPRALVAYEPAHPPAPLSFAEATRHSAVRATLAAGLYNGWANFGLRVAIMPLFIAALAPGSPQLAGIALAVFAVGSAVVMQFSGRLSDRLGRKPLIMAGLAVSAGAMGALALTPSVWMVIALSVLTGMGAGLMNPSTMAVLADVVGQHRGGGKVLSGFQMVQDCGAILGPILAGMLIDHGGFGAAWVGTALIGVVALVLWLPAAETLPTGRLYRRQTDAVTTGVTAPRHDGSAATQGE